MIKILDDANRRVIYNLDSSPIIFQNINTILDVKYQGNKLSWHSQKKFLTTLTVASWQFKWR